MNKPHEMTFTEFAASVKPTAGMNRWPQLGAAADVVSYSVYLNGPDAKELPQSLQEQEFKDVLLHPLTEKLGLNSQSMRDNLKVAELVALRHSYMSMLLDASMSHKLSERMQDEYRVLSEGLNHPYIREQIAQQKGLSAKLEPVLSEAAKVLGAPAREKPAGGVSRGDVISQNAEFTVQALEDGQVVAHENNRLAKVPALGDNITVAYYKGRGQVFNARGMQFSEPEVDGKTGDLAVKVVDARGTVQQVVLFNSVVAVKQFAEEFALGDDFVSKAIEVRNRTPKPVPELPTRQALGDPYLDKATNTLALDYKEGAVKYTALFVSATELDQYLQRFSMNRALAEKAHVIQVLAAPPDPAIIQHSLQEAKHIASSMKAIVQPVNAKSGRYSGPVVATTELHVVQDLGRNSYVIHDKRHLDKVPLPGERMSLSYSGGRAEVQIREASKARESGVSR